MKYCTHCGNQLLDEAIVCPKCGCAVDPVARSFAPSEPDVPSTGMNVLAFFLPLIGLILYLTEKDKTPVKAKAMGKWALIGFCVGIGVYIFLNVLTVVFFMAMDAAAVIPIL